MEEYSDDMSFEEIAADLEGNEGAGRWGEPGGGYERERWEEQPPGNDHAGGNNYAYYHGAQYEEEEFGGPPDQDAHAGAYSNYSNFSRRSSPTPSTYRHPAPADSHPTPFFDPAPSFTPNETRIVRPTPKSNFVPLRPQPQLSRPLPPAPHPLLRSFSRPQPQSSFPIPLNGNTNRRKDEHLRPPGGQSPFQNGAGGSYASGASQVASRAQSSGIGQGAGGEGSASRAAVRNGKRRIVEQEEEDYFGEDDAAFELELQRMEVPDALSSDPIRETTQQQRFQPPQQSFGNSRQARPSYDQDDGSSYCAAPASQEPRRGGIKLRPVSDLPDLYRSLWKFGIFNAVQSTVFDSIYQSDENVVVSAPTGAGKTVLFELAILRLFSTSALPDAKCVYMAPTKALCSERAKDWKAKFGRLGWDVIELTGDSTSGAGTLKDVGNAKVIVTTPEKFDAMTRRWHVHEKVLAKLGLFCLDECHFIGLDVRGAVLEVVVSRMKTLGTHTRFIALSATAPNIEDLAQWLGENDQRLDGRARSPATVFKFGEEFRPCKLQKVVVSYYKKDDNDFLFNSTLNHKLMELLKQYASGKPVLVFCNTRKGCAQAADVLAKEYRELVDKKSGGNLPWPKPPRVTTRFNDKHLGVLAELGISYHHAGLDAGDRRAVEQGFLDGSIFVLCATSTLATGVNLPARMVIVKGTKMYGDAGFVEYSDLDMLQMMGRAGRPQFDTQGIACIMTEKNLQAHYEALANSETILESCLHRNLTEHINSEIALKTITSVPTALLWLRSTFLFVRINKNPAHYAIGNDRTSPEARLEEICVEAVGQLVESGVVEEGTDSLSPTELGDMMSRYYLAHSTFISLNALPPKANMRTLLETLSACSEFQKIRFRSGEKGLYTKQNKNLKYPCAKLATSADKVMILIQLVLQGIPLAEVKLNDSNPTVDSNLVWQHAPRIAKCIVDLALEHRDGGVKTALELLRSLNTKAWEGSPFILRQLDGIGEKGVKALSDKGIATFRDLYESEPSRIELILNRNPPFGKKLIAQARSFPQFLLNLTAEDGSEKALDIGVKVTLQVEVGLVVTSPPPQLKKGRARFWASILLVTSDGEYLEFRRTKTEQLLAGPKTFSISVVLVKPSQRIIGTVGCEDLGGSEVRAVYKPTTKGSSYPIPAIGHTAISNALPTETRSDEDDEEPVLPKASNKARPVIVAEEDAKPESPPPARQLANGNWACNHRCTDKTTCRHLCCREGLEKPPVTRHKPKKAKVQSYSTSLGSSKPPVAKAKLFDTLDRPSSKVDPPPVRARHFQPKTTKSGPGPKLGTSLRGNMSTSFDSSSSDDLPLIASLSTAKILSHRVSQSSTTNKSSTSAPTPIEIDELSDEDAEIDQLDSPTPSPPPQKKLPTKRASSTSIFPEQPKRSKGPLDVAHSSTSATSSASAKPKERLFLLSPSRSPELELAMPVDEVETELEITGPAAEVEEQQMEEEVAKEEESRTDEDADFEEWMQENVLLVA